jgi:hypothetical protein
MEPNTGPAASGYWIIAYFIRPCEIHSLKQTRDTIDARFHKGIRIANLTLHLVEGSTTNEYTSVVVARLQGKLWVVYGNRRLHEMQNECAPCLPRHM